jgi:endonuclease YncB( thermonuclease family)
MTKCERKTLVLVFLFLFAIPSICYAWSGKVVSVADGDTITVMKGEKRVRVRLYGIDTGVIVKMLKAIIRIMNLCITFPPFIVE